MATEALPWTLLYLTALICVSDAAKKPNFVIMFMDDVSLTNRAIHKAASFLVTGRSQKSRRLEPPPEVVPPLTASQLERWNDGIVPVKSWNGWEP